MGIDTVVVKIKGKLNYHLDNNNTNMKISLNK